MLEFATLASVGLWGVGTRTIVDFFYRGKKALIRRCDLLTEKMTAMFIGSTPLIHM